jgi:hypothetical protein
LVCLPSLDSREASQLAKLRLALSGAAGYAGRVDRSIDADFARL